MDLEMELTPRQLAQSMEVESEIDPDMELNPQKLA